MVNFTKTYNPYAFSSQTKRGLTKESSSEKKREKEKETSVSHH